MPKYTRFCIVFLCRDMVRYGQAPNIMKDFKILRVLMFYHFFIYLIDHLMRKRKRRVESAYK